jgi:general stress protein 26
MVVEHTREEGLVKMKELVDGIHTCMFITGNNIQNHVRPMATVRTDKNGDLWFFSEMHSEKVADIKSNQAVQLLYSHPGKDAYLDVRGIASIETNRDKIQELWTPIAKAWFPNGVDDPNLCLVKVEPESVYYWDNGNNKMTFLLKSMAAAITGKKSNEGEEGVLMH